jgi:hypothetical protein
MVKLEQCKHQLTSNILGGLSLLIFFTALIIEISDVHLAYITQTVLYILVIATSVLSFLLAKKLELNLVSLVGLIISFLLLCTR